MQQGGIMEAVIKAFLKLNEAFFPFGILLADLFPVKIIYDAGDDRFHLLLHQIGLKQGIRQNA